MLCDTFIITKDDKLRAHSNVLAAWCPAFLLSVPGELEYQSKHVLDLSKFDTDLVQMILDFLYTGEFEMSPQSLEHEQFIQFRQLIETLGVNLKNDK